jgi:hypothetical protein
MKSVRFIVGKEARGKSFTIEMGGKAVISFG